MAEITNEDILIKTPFHEKAEKKGITDKFLITRLKRGFNAKTPVNIKIKGAVNPDDLPKGYKIIATSGVLTYDKEGKRVFSDGETIIRFDYWDMGIQEGARKDTHKLRGDYPAVKQELTGPGGGPLIVSLKEKLREALDRADGEQTKEVNDV